MRTSTVLPKESKAGMLLALIVGIIFTSLGLLMASGFLQGRTCEYLCTFGVCFSPEYMCTSQELFFWQTGLLFIGIICLLLAGIAYLKTLSK